MECVLGKPATCTMLVRVVLRNTLKPQKARSESDLIVNLSDIVPNPFSNILIQLVLLTLRLHFDTDTEISV